MDKYVTTYNEPVFKDAKYLGSNIPLAESMTILYESYEHGAIKLTPQLQVVQGSHIVFYASLEYKRYRKDLQEQSDNELAEMARDALNTLRTEAIEHAQITFGVSLAFPLDPLSSYLLWAKKARKK